MKILGFKVNVKGGAIFLALILTVLLALGTLGLYPQYDLWVHVAIGALGGILFVASILIHELAHSVVARRNNIGIEQIDLNLFGGASYLKSFPKSPGVDFRVAFVGPLSSFILGIIFYGIALLIVALSGPVILGYIFVYLAFINVLLAVFNLLPGAPLDGGRVVRSIVWKITGSFKKGAIFATYSGQVIAVLLGLLGAFLIFNGDAFGGIWIAYIAFTIYAGAVAERYVIKEGLYEEDDGPLQQDGK